MGVPSNISIEYSAKGHTASLRIPVSSYFNTDLVFFSRVKWDLCKIALGERH